MVSVLLFNKGDLVILDFNKNINKRTNSNGALK